MGEFKRQFDCDGLSEHSHVSVLARLFERWVLPGECAGAHGLRVAVRNNYLNLYVKGQSVAELSLVKKSPRLKLHRKYFELAEKGSPRARDLGQKYVQIDAKDLSQIDPDTVDAWIRTAETYAGDEKRFVDDLVAVTAGTIDMEMGLPANDDATERTAPRMDLVVAQGTEIAFWEAKVVDNGELRARAPYREASDGTYVKGPKVIWQLRNYDRWVRSPNREKEVREFYMETARILLCLAKIFDKKEGPAQRSWRALKDAGEEARVILPPGVVVADYCPLRADGVASEKAAIFKAKGRSFPRHEAILQAHGVTMQRVSSQPSGPVLPHLHPGAISP